MSTPAPPLPAAAAPPADPNVVNVEVNGVPLKARKGQMIIELTDQAEIYVPRFCYHPKLSIAANCRMCLVEVEKAPKPLPACATPVAEGMKIFTRSKRAISAQKGVHHVGMGGAHAVRQPLVDLERAVLQQLRRQQRGVGDRHDLVVIAVHHERRDPDDLQILGEVGLREGLNAVVLSLGATSHCLSYPILDHGLRHLRAWPVETVERDRELGVELRTARGKLLAEAVEHLDGQATGSQAPSVEARGLYKATVAQSPTT